MRVRTTVFFLPALVLSAVTACSTFSSESGVGGPSAPSPSASSASAAALPSDRLRARLLTAADLGPGYTVRFADPPASSWGEVLGCAPLERLAAWTGDPYARFPARARAVITGPGPTKVTEELFSAAPAELSVGIRRIMSAMTACPTYRLAIAATVFEVSTRITPAPPLGEEQWAQIVTVRANGRSQVTQQVVVRDGSLLVVLSGSPAEVKLHVERALDKAAAR
ncbi:hypothetical protein AB0C52_24790 [Streptomyces sp. NPDC048717]|uniref:hypothetical protein n=1 Tax=Streptomyces sp. NPDC048717 TaxID=3154928 RepID=UPI0034477F72